MAEGKNVTNDFEALVFRIIREAFDEPAQAGSSLLIGGFHLAINKDSITVTANGEERRFNKVSKAIKHLRKHLKKRGKKNDNPSDFHEIVQRYFNETKRRGKHCTIVRTPTGQPWFIWWSRKNKDYRFKASTTLIEDIILGNKKQQAPYRHTLASHSLHELCKAIHHFPKAIKAFKGVEVKRSELGASDIVQEVDPLRRKWVFKEKLLNIVIIEFEIPYRKIEQRQR